MRTGAIPSLRDDGAAVNMKGWRAAGGTRERVAYEPSAGRALTQQVTVVGSGPAGEGATPSGGQDPQRAAPTGDRVVDIG